MLYLGIDVHYRVSVVCILDENGRRVKTVTVKGHWQNLLAFLKGVDKPFRVCYEASTGYGWLVQNTAKSGDSIQVFAVSINFRRKTSKVSPDYPTSKVSPDYPKN